MALAHTTSTGFGHDGGTMRVRTATLAPQVPRLVACARTTVHTPGMTQFSSQDFIRWKLSPAALTDLFGHAPPYEDMEIAATAAAWETKVGIKNRMIYTGTTEQMGAHVALKLLEDLDLDPKEVTRIREVRFATNTGLGYPNGADAAVAAIIEHYQLNPHDWEPRAERIQQACSVGVQGLQDADQAIRSGAIEGGYYLLIVAEKTSELASWDDWDAVNLFGDGAVAFLFEASDHPTHDCFLGYEGITSPGNGQIDYIRQKAHGFEQDGNLVHKFVLGKVPDRIRMFMEAMEIDPIEIKHLILHQPSGRTLEPLHKRIKKIVPNLAGAQFHYCFDQTTNMSSVSCLWEFIRAREEGEIRPGELILLVAFGAGMSMSIMLMIA